MLRLRSDVRLTPLALAHASDMYRWVCDPVVSRNIGLRSSPSLEKTKAWIREALRGTSTRPFAILLDGQHVGNVVLDRIDDHICSARLSVYIGEAFARGAGVGLTAVYLALSEGFERMALHKIWLTVHVENLSAIRSYTKLGFVLEGILRDDFWLDAQRVAVLYMSILDHEYQRRAVVKVQD